VAGSATERATGGTAADSSGDRCGFLTRGIVILDTNAISAWAENDAALMALLPADRPWYVPSIVLGEFRYGLLGSTRRAELEPWLDAVEQACLVLMPDALTARRDGTLRRALDAAAVRVPYHDLWIGALALQHDLPVVSRDADFEKMPGVRRLDW
jgi:tRNA(fMet)-specific endonuclease VapC